jgi:hypothetical protein
VLAASPPSGAAAARARVAVLEVLHGQAQVRSGPAGWQTAEAGAALATGDGVRVDAQGLARVRLPWVALLIGPATVAGLGTSRVLSATLEEGRLEQRSERGILKLRTGEAEVRGRGHVIVRRRMRRTLVSVLAGEFRVRAGRATMVLRAGEGALAAPGRAPLGPLPLPAAPSALQPGADPRYVAEGQPVPLAWAAAGQTHHVQVLAAGADEVMLAMDVGPGPLTLHPPGLGTFRWRVSARSGDGLEGPPSAPGAFAIVAH